MRPVGTDARIVILADVHGNTAALDAVLEDARRGGESDAHLVLGDVAATGYDPAGSVERLAALPGVRFVIGNADRYALTGERPMRAPTLEDARGDPALLAQLLQTARSFAWTAGALAASGWLDWLAGLPLEQRLPLPDGTRLLAVHASPGLDDGPGIPPGLADGELAGMLAGCGAELVCVGHTHRALDRSAGGVRVVNPGSVGLPLDGDRRPAYAVLEAGVEGYTIEHRRVEYDRERAIAALRRVRHPATDFIAGLLLGRREGGGRTSGPGDPTEDTDGPRSPSGNSPHALR